MTDTVHTGQVKELVALQRMDTALDALKARAAAVPEEIAAREKAFKTKVAGMSAAREALQALQSKKKALELEIADCDEALRKHQRDLNALKDNAAFKAMLAEMEHDKKKKDDLETAVLTLLEEIDAAAAEDAALREEVKKLEAVKDSELDALRAEHMRLENEAAQAAAARAAAAAAIEPGLLEKYEHLRPRRGGLALAEAREDAGAGKFTCGGCHMSLTPQAALDSKKKDTLAVCPDCRRLLYAASVPGAGQ